VTTTAISAAVPRKRTTLAGRVTHVATYVRPWIRFEADLSDRTGTIRLRFLGRTEVPGMVTGCRVSVEGTPSLEYDSLVMLNPLYQFLGGSAECRDHTGGSRRADGEAKNWEEP
jgi:hypothetical protein